MNNTSSRIDILINENIKCDELFICVEHLDYAVDLKLIVRLSDYCDDSDRTVLYEMLCDQLLQTVELLDISSLVSRTVEHEDF